MKNATTGYLVLGMVNNNLVLCTDGDFHARSLVGPGGWSPKVYKTEAGAKKSWPENPVVALGT